MALLRLGNHSFEIIGLNYQSLSRTTTAHWVPIARFGGKAAKQFTGKGADDKATISGLLFPEEFGGREEYEAIRLTQGQGRPVMMVGFGANGAGRIFGKVCIETVSDTQDYISPNGQGKKQQFSIQISPY